MTCVTKFNFPFLVVPRKCFFDLIDAVTSVRMPTIENLSKFSILAMNHTVSNSQLNNKRSSIVSYTSRARSSDIDTLFLQA